MIGTGSLVLSGIALAAISGIPGALTSRHTNVGQWLSTILAVAGGLCGVVGAWQSLAAPVTEVLLLPSPFPNAKFDLASDALSAMFLVPIFLVSLLGSIYGLDYWKQTEHPENGRKLRVFYGLLTASLAILVLARNSVTFLFGWEAMAVSAFFLVSTEDHDAEVRVAGWTYLAASHGATLCLFVMFGLMYGLTGSYDLVPLATGKISPAAATAIFLLALAGFGLKAGIMPLHFWLPSAHAMAPSHVSAIMSGVLIKTGIYGLVRITSLLPQPPLWWGGLVLALGVVSAVLGVAFALGQHDLKRLLAYHSIENIGIIVIGLAIAMLGRTMEQPAWVMLGMAGCLLHVWNHALFKSLLFLSAGSVIHARDTREIDRLGGLAKPMPWTSAAFLIGAAAICGLPPLNGFVSEFLVYSGLFATLGLDKGSTALPAVAFAVPALALMGALAVACFVKVFGVVFLGVNRVPHSQPAHESPWTMLLPLGVLVACCAAIGLAPTFFAPALDRATAVWMQQPVAPGALLGVAALGRIGAVAIALLIALVAGRMLLEWRLATQPLAYSETWGCGYAAPTPRMQYTASSLAQILVTLFGWSLQPRVHRPQLRELFPRSAHFVSHVPEVVLDMVVLPVFEFLGRILLWIRLMQQGSIHIYLVYIFAILVLLLLFWR